MPEKKAIRECVVVDEVGLTEDVNWEGVEG